jgi:Ca2+-binding EF-hand superfamily protein
MSLINGINNTTPYIEKLASKQGQKKATSQSDTQASQSSVVTLSEDAKALVNFTNKGIAVSMKGFDTPLTGATRSDNYTQYPSEVTDKKITKDEFANLLSSLGVNDSDTQKLVSGFDTNSDNEISHAEILKALSDTSQSNNLLSQSILNLMDKTGNGDGKVSAQEFATISTKFYDAES